MERCIKLFENKKVRTHLDIEKEKQYFAIIDIIEILTETKRPRTYWSDLKSKLKKKGNQMSELIGQLKLESSDWKKYLTDIADTEQVRLIQFIPSYRQRQNFINFQLAASEYSNNKLLKFIFLLLFDKFKISIPII